MNQTELLVMSCLAVVLIYAHAVVYSVRPKLTVKANSMVYIAHSCFFCTYLPEMVFLM